MYPKLSLKFCLRHANFVFYNDDDDDDDDDDDNNNNNNFFNFLLHLRVFFNRGFKK